VDLTWVKASVAAATWRTPFHTGGCRESEVAKGNVGYALIASAVLLPVVFPPTPHAADDTFSCLTQLSGPETMVSGDHGYKAYAAGVPAQNARFDARDATWKHQTYPEKVGDVYTIQLGILNRRPSVDEWTVTSVGNNACWAGGTVIGTNSPRVPAPPWGAINKVHYGDALMLNSMRGVVDGFRVDNMGEDGIATFNSANFIIKDTWISHISDDCIENDALHSGIIADSLLDGCFMAISIDPGANYEGVSKRANRLTLDGVLLKVESGNMSDRPRYDESGVWLKTHRASPSLRIYKSILAFDDFSTRDPLLLRRAWERIIDCKGNVIAWLSDAAFPSNFPTTNSCFKIVKGKMARSLWSAAKQNWINCHPKVGRVPGDPASHFSKCDSGGYGGGGTATPTIDDSTITEYREQEG
jgi:hypothetical protein